MYTNNETLKTFPDKSKFVNKGSSALLSGGQAPRKQKLKKCYLITLIENESPEHYDIKAIPYGDLTETKERDNLLCLPNKNYVFVCYDFSQKYVNIPIYMKGLGNQ